MIESDPGCHPKLYDELPVVLLEENITGPAEALEDEFIEENAVATTTSTNSSIVHNPGVCDDNSDPISMINPNNTTTHDAECDDH